MKHEMKIAKYQNDHTFHQCLYSPISCFQKRSSMPDFDNLPENLSLEDIREAIINFHTYWKVSYNLILHICVNAIRGWTQTTLKRNSPTCRFMWACTSIWYTRVGKLRYTRVGKLNMISSLKTFQLFGSISDTFRKLNHEV